MRSRKRFGQNFLTDHNTISRIIGAIDPCQDDYIVEIGPGHGELTAPLVKSGCRLEVIEIDRDLIADLRARFPELGIIASDILKYDFTNMIEKVRAADTRLRIVGNLPYNISTPLLFKLFNYLPDIRDMHFMLQLEVVDRMVAAPSTSAYGRLSVMAQYYCEATRLFSVPATAFTPRPRVMSAIVRLLPRRDGPKANNTSVLQGVVSEAFSHRRKTIRNALKSLMSESDFIALSLDPKLRPENLTVADYVRCANHISERSSRQPEGSV